MHNQVEVYSSHAVLFFPSLSLSLSISLSLSLSLSLSFSLSFSLSLSLSLSFPNEIFHTETSDKVQTIFLHGLLPSCDTQTNFAKHLPRLQSSQSRCHVSSTFRRVLLSFALSSSQDPSRPWPGDHRFSLWKSSLLAKIESRHALTVAEMAWQHWGCRFVAWK